MVGARSFGGPSPSAAAHAVSIGRLEQHHLFLRHVHLCLPDRPQIVYHPKTAALRSGYEVVTLHGEVGDGHDGQIELEGLPVGAVVERNVHAGFSTRIQQTFARRVGAEYAGEMLRRNAFGDEFPGAAVVLGFVEIRRIVADFVAGAGYVNTAFIERIGINAVDHHPFGHTGRRHILPVAPAVAADMNEAVVGAGPEQPFLIRRFYGGKDGAVVLHSCVVFGDGTAGRAEFGGVVAGQVGADDVPALAAVGGGVEVIGGGVEFFGIVGREENGEVPLEAVLHTFCAVSDGVVGPHVDGLRFVGFVVGAGQESAIAAAIHDVVVERVHGDVAAFAAGSGLPVLLGDGAAVGAVQDAHSGVVLLRAIDAVGEVVIGHDAVKLRGGLVVVGAPVFAAVEGYLCAAVVAYDHALVIFGRYPEVVVVAVGCFIRFEGAPAVGGLVIIHIEHIHNVGVFGIGIDAGVVPGALAQGAVFVELLPALAAVVGAIHAALIGLHDGPHAVLLHGRGRYADDAERAFGKAFVFRNLHPGIAAVGAFPQGRTLAAAF